MKKKNHSVPPNGIHIILDLYKCEDPSILNSPEEIKKILEQAVKVSKATLLEIKIHKFEPQGVSGFALISESHISVHTWPEANYVGVDIYTCGKKTMPEKAAKILIEKFKSKNPSILKIERGFYAKEK